MRKVDSALLFQTVHSGDPVFENVPRKVRKIVSVDQLAQTQPAVDQFYLYRRISLLQLQKTCGRDPLRTHQTVNAEIAVVGKLAVAAAVRVVAFFKRFGNVLGDARRGILGMQQRVQHRWLSVNVDRRNAVVRPFPDAAANETRVSVNDLPVILRITGAVAHGVGIFAKEKGYDLFVFLVFFQIFFTCLFNVTKF